MIIPYWLYTDSAGILEKLFSEALCAKALNIKCQSKIDNLLATTGLKIVLFPFLFRVTLFMHPTMKLLVISLVIGHH